MSDGPPVYDEESGWHDAGKNDGTWETSVSKRAVTVGRTWLAVTVAIGTLAGMGTFVFAHAGLMPEGVPEWAPAAVVAFSGAIVPAFVGTLMGSIRVALGGYVVAFVTLTLAWVGPYWLVPYGPGARDLLLYSRLGRVAVHGLSSLLLPYFAGYLSAVLVVGYLDP